MIECPKCHKTQSYVMGWEDDGYNYIVQFHCKKCNHVWVEFHPMY
nr:MAG: hypothetical protein [Lokiarchaeota virus Skoll Meg22_1214]